MKKLVTIIATIGLIFIGSNAFAAACDCGYKFDLGPGTLTQDLDLTDSNNIQTNAYGLTSACFQYVLNQTFPEPATQCVAVQLSPLFVDPVDGTFANGNDFAYRYMYVAITGGWGTGTIGDLRDMPANFNSCPVTIMESHNTVKFEFDEGNYTSTQATICGTDYNAVSLVANEFADRNSLQLLYKGYVTAKPEVGVEITLAGPNTGIDFSGGITNVIVTSAINYFRAEYFSRLPEDVNNDGLVTGSDFLAVVAALNAGASKACFCFGYFQ